MAPDLVNTTITELIAEIREDLEEAAALALAAEACAERGSVGKATEIANEINDFTHDVSRFLAVIVLIRRRSKRLPFEGGGS